MGLLPSISFTIQMLTMLIKLYRPIVRVRAHTVGICDPASIFPVRAEDDTDQSHPLATLPSSASLPHGLEFHN